MPKVLNLHSRFGGSFYFTPLLVFVCYTGKYSGNAKMLIICLLNIQVN